MNASEVKQYLSRPGGGLFAIDRMRTKRKIDTIRDDGDLVRESKLTQGTRLGLAQCSHAPGSAQVTSFIQKISESLLPSGVTHCPGVQHAMRRDHVRAVPGRAVLVRGQTRILPYSMGVRHSGGEARQLLAEVGRVAKGFRPYWFEYRDGHRLPRGDVAGRELVRGPKNSQVDACLRER